jgi:hypothetical protein
MTGPIQGLKLPNLLPTGVGQSKKDSIRQFFNTADDMEDQFRNHGFTEIPQPQVACPQLTEADVTNPDSTEFTATYVSLLAWYTYCGELSAKVQARLIQYQNGLDVIAAETRNTARLQHESGAKKLTVEEMKDRLLLNAEYREVLLEQQKYEQLRKLLDQRLESIDRSMKVVSRQVTIRSLDLDSQGRVLRTEGRQPRTLGGR